MKVCIKEKLNHIPHLNDFLDERNLEMEVGDQMECVAFTNRQEFEAIERKYPILIRDVIVILVYIWHEMLPKMDLTRKFYFFLTGSQVRSTPSFLKILRSTSPSMMVVWACNPDRLGSCARARRQFSS